MKTILYICYTALFALLLAFLGAMAVVGVQVAIICWRLGYVPAP